MDPMIELHKSALDEISAARHEFLGKYKKRKKMIYGFVEGVEDPSFYRGFIEHSILPDWEVALWPAGKRDNVIKIYSKFKWNCFPKCQIAFFIDRDLSGLIGEELPSDINIFVTEKYSIENHIVNRSTCDRILCEVFNLSTLTDDDKEKLLDLFDTQFELFLQSMIPIMAEIIHWKRSGKKPSLDNIEMKHIFSISNGKIIKTDCPKGKKSIREYIHSQCALEIDNNADISSIEKELRNENQYRSFTRGKYVFWYLVEFTKNVHRDISQLIPSIGTPPKIHTTLSQKNGVVIIAPRTRIPESLNFFLKNTYITYINEMEAIN